VERAFITSRPDVFRYSSSYCGYLYVDLHGVFDCEDGITNSIDIVKKLLSVQAAESKMVDKHRPVDALCIEVITGKGMQHLYNRVRRTFESWRDEGSSSIVRRYLACL
jgi:hypothetical protein